MEADATDVLVVGAGPTGLTLACELRRHGLSCRIIDELEAPVVYSKAAAVHARTLEVFDDMGVAGAFLDHAKVIHGARLHSGGKLIARAVLDGIESHYPHVYGASQRETERVLTEHLERLGGTLERGLALQSFVADEGRVTAQVKAKDGSARPIEARWLVGCDGAHSVVRKALGCTFEGSPYEEYIIQADVRVDFPSRECGDGDDIMMFFSPDGPVAFFPLFKDGRYRVIVIFMSGASEVEVKLETFQRIVNERGPRDAKLSDPAWMVPFRIHHRRSNRYGDGPVFLAGDAAHIHSPAGGQGMNTSIQDAYNLAWKLALVARGRARPSFLDSYEAERLPIAKDLLANTDSAMRGMETVGPLKNPIAVGLRNQFLSMLTGFSPFTKRFSRGISMTTIGYQGSPIVREDRPSIFRADLLGTSATEAPGLVDWAAFGDGPAPGERAPEVYFPEGAPGPARMGEVLRGTKHTLLLFDGAAATPAGYENLSNIAGLVKERFGDVIEPHVIVPYDKKPTALSWAGSVLFDAEGDVHRRYGARSECLYLVRPDGYVAYRCQPAGADKLKAYLDTIFVALE